MTRVSADIPAYPVMNPLLRERIRTIARRDTNPISRLDTILKVCTGNYFTATPSLARHRCDPSLTRIVLMAIYVLGRHPGTPGETDFAECRKMLERMPDTEMTIAAMMDKVCHDFGCTPEMVLKSLARAEPLTLAIPALGPDGMGAVTIVAHEAEELGVGLEPHGQVDNDAIQRPADEISEELNVEPAPDEDAYDDEDYEDQEPEPEPDLGDDEGDPEEL